jgi:hypothetical protein
LVLLVAAYVPSRNRTALDGVPRLIPREDEAVSAAAADILRREGIDMRLNVKSLKVEKRGEGIAINLGAQRCCQTSRRYEGSASPLFSPDQWKSSRSRSVRSFSRTGRRARR